MDTRIESDRTIIEQTLTEYAKYPYSYGEIDRQLVFDRERDHYVLLSVGWDKHRVHGCVIHIDLIDGKFWIQRDGTETGVAFDLEAAGISKNWIVLAFKSLRIRPHTGYAVA
jgi:XisI protein